MTGQAFRSIAEISSSGVGRVLPGAHHVAANGADHPRGLDEPGDGVGGVFVSPLLSAAGLVVIGRGLVELGRPSRTPAPLGRLPGRSDRQVRSGPGVVGDGWGHGGPKVTSLHGQSARVGGELRGVAAA
jgi:hypothetical protein